VTGGNRFRTVVGRLATVLATVAASAAHPASVRAQPQQPTSASPPASDPANGAMVPAPLPDTGELIRRDITQLATMLNDPQASRDQHDEAARRLVARRSPEARQILSGALFGVANPDAQRAAAMALADDPEPDPALIDPLFALLGGNRAQADAAARALVNYKNRPDVLTRLTNFVQNTRNPESNRTQVIRALGSRLEKWSAETLLGLLNAQNESAAIRRAAAEALGELSGIESFGDDAQRWNDWWARNRDKADDEFAREPLERRSARYEKTSRDYNDLAAELRKLLPAHYRAAAPTQRQDLLMTYLTSPQPQVRVVGAQIARDAVGFNETIPPAAREQLRTMIGDSSAAVRMAVADALSKINDAAALEALLTQLAQERDGQVRARIADALGPINDLRAVPALLTMLNDENLEAATAAAKALALDKLARKLREADPAMARRVADALREALLRNPSSPGNDEFRRALVNAMGLLHEESMLPTLTNLLAERNGESTDMRRSALRAIGEIGNPQLGAVVADVMSNDRDRDVRYEAVQALGKMPVAAAEYADLLLYRLDANNERDETVREASWQVLQNVLSRLSKERLNTMADRVKDQPPRRLVVLQALEGALVNAGTEDELANTRQNIGEVLMRIGDPKQAAEAFRQALEYKKKQPLVPAIVVEGLMRELMRALLLSKQYPEAIAFASEAIRESPNNRQEMGSAIKQEADRLRNAGDLDGALKLIEEARKMETLPPQYRDDLAEIESDVRKRQGERSGNPGTRVTLPQNAGLETAAPANGR
jgi:HEAT repeat protein